MSDVRSGYGATLTITSGTGSYDGAELTDVRVEINHEPIDVTDLASTYRERVGGLLDWTVTGRKNYASNAFISHCAAAPSSIVKATIKNPSGTTVFAGWGYVTRGLLNFPMGASNEEVQIVGTVSGTVGIITP